MANKNLFYDTGIGKPKEINNFYFDDTNNKLFFNKIVFSKFSSNLSNGIIFSNNTTFSSSVQDNNQILLWDSSVSNWKFSNVSFSDVSSFSIGAQSDVSGTFLNNCTVTSISNVSSGTLSNFRGGTGLNNSELIGSSNSFFISDGTDKLKFTNISSSVTGSKQLPQSIILANLTASSAKDQSYNSNTMTIVKGTYSNPPVASPFGAGPVMFSSYDANSANYNASINMPFSNTTDFTMECWAYLTNVGGTPYDVSRSAIISNNNNFGLNGGVSTQNGTTGFYTVYVSNYDAWTNLPFIANQWVYLVMVRKDDYFRVYANATGSQVFNVTNTSIPETSKVWIGNSNGNWNPNGYITEVKYFTYAKSTEEIKTHYQAVLSGTRGRENRNTVYTKNFISSNIALTIDENNRYSGTSSIDIDDINGINIKTVIW